MAYENVLRAIEDIKSGKMIVMVDDENRENEGDVVCAAAFCDVEKVNFMISHAKGVLCAPLTRELARRLDLSPMVASNTSTHETAFTISIDAKQALTGVSAYERSMTIKMLVDPNIKAGDFVRPGHIFPLIAKEGGVLERTGHTEGSVDLCKLAGLAPVSVICEIVKDDGSMARRADLERFCAKFGLSMISVSDIIEYRLKNEKLISVATPKMANLAGFTAKSYEIKDHLDNLHYAYVFGEISQSTNVKFHKICSDLHLLSSPKYAKFMQYLEILSKEGGILVFLNGEDANSEVFKNYGIGAQILAHFGVKDITILSSSQKEFVAINGFGLNILGYK